jgi:glucose/arabinose dehydrogenase
MERTVLKNRSGVHALAGIVAVAAFAMAFASTTAPGQTPGAPQPPAVAPLGDLKVPPGFKASVFASDLAGARLMTLSPEGVLLVARRRTNEVVALPDRDKDGKAEPRVLLTGLTTELPTEKNKK